MLLLELSWATCGSTEEVKADLDLDFDLVKLNHFLEGLDGDAAASGRPRLSNAPGRYADVGLCGGCVLAALSIFTGSGIAAASTGAVGTLSGSSMGGAAFACISTSSCPSHLAAKELKGQLKNMRTGMICRAAATLELQGKFAMLCSPGNVRGSVSASAAHSCCLTGHLRLYASCVLMHYQAQAHLGHHFWLRGDILPGQEEVPEVLVNLGQLHRLVVLCKRQWN